MKRPVPARAFVIVLLGLFAFSQGVSGGQESEGLLEEALEEEEVPQEAVQPDDVPPPEQSPGPQAPDVRLLRLIDAHNHWPVGLSADTLIAVLDQARVSRIVLMQNGANQQEPLPLFEAYPDRVIPFVGNVNGRRNRATLERVDRQLSSGQYHGIGELLVLHYAVDPESHRGNQAPRIEIPPDSSWVLDLFCLATKHNVAVTVHMESTPETVAALERSLSQYPHAKVIWAHQTPLKTFGGQTADHARQADPGQLAALFDRYPNLFADLAIGHETAFLSRQDRQLPDAWRDLYELYSGRFVVGADLPFLSGWEPASYMGRVGWFYSWLEQLSPAAQARLAHENMERILAAKPASGQTCAFRTA